MTHAADLGTAPDVVLALETSTEFCSVALLVVPAGRTSLPACNAGTLPEGVHAYVRHARTGAVSSTQLLPDVQAVFEEAALPMTAVSAIAFGAGPGAFTGLRTATGVAQGLAYGLEVPVVPVGTLMACAEAARAADAGADCVLAAQDARMDEVYWAWYDWHDDEPLGWRVAQAEALSAPETLQPAARPFVLAGNAAAAFGARLGVAAQARAIDAAALPHALPTAVLGWRAWRAGLAVPAAQAAPRYVRDKVAQTTEERAAARAASDAAGAAP
jgi:tRNA threonylcarbamoyladenosine biosynthesis protein TsaB